MSEQPMTQQPMSGQPISEQPSEHQQDERQADGRPAGGRPTATRPITKAEKRAAAKAEKQRAADARQRRQALIGMLAGLAVVAVIVAAFVLVGGSGTEDEVAPDTAAAPPAATQPPAEPTAPPADPAFPPLPEGADPALGTKPKVGKGTGELTKLKVKTLIQGDGPATKAGQTIEANYVGVFYPTGEEFDSSWTRSQAITFQLGAGNVIPGWDQGLVGVKVGSRVQLDLPANLAYGDNPEGGRPGGPLRFVVDVLGVR